MGRAEAAGLAGSQGLQPPCSTGPTASLPAGTKLQATSLRTVGREATGRQIRAKEYVDQANKLLSAVNAQEIEPAATTARDTL